jgi:hypothetical protein
MGKIALLILVISLILLLPVLVNADAAVAQDSCEVVGDDQLRVYFTVYNMDLPRSICSFQLIPEHQPPEQECIAVDCGPAEGWACSLNGFGGAWYGAPPHDPPSLNCIAPGASKGGFYITIDPGWCCYTVRYADETGVAFLEEKECLTTCSNVPVEQMTWGAVKTIYRR